MTQKKLISGAVLLSAGTFASYILGAVRDAVFGNFFGVSGLTDAYLGAFLMSDILMMIFISSALLGLATPLYLREKAKNPEISEKIFGNFFASLLLVFASVLMIAGFFTPEIFAIISPEIFARYPHEFVLMGRLFLVSNFIFAVSNFLGTYLMAHKHFVSTALAPLLYNVGILAGILFLPNSDNILNAAYGAVFGAFLHLCSRGIEYFWNRKNPEISGFAGFVPNINFSHPVLRELHISMLWKMGSVVIMPIVFLIFMRVASAEEGLYTAFQYMRNLQSAPVAIFGIALATAVFPVLSQFQAEKNEEKFLENFWRVAGNILFWTVPAAVGIFFVGDQVLAILYGISENSQAFEWIGIISVFLSLALVFEAMFHLLSRAFYSSKDISTPLVAGILFVASASITLFLGHYFFPEKLVYFLAGAYMVGYIFQSSFLLWKGFGIKLLKNPKRNFWKKFQRICIWTGVMGISLFFASPFVEQAEGIFQKILTIGGVSGISALLYFFPEISGKVKKLFIAKK